MDDLKLKSRKLRKNQTPHEQKLWSLLRCKQINGCKFLRQYVIKPYIADFICREKKLIIELDGGQHNDDTNIEYDRNRTKYLESLGYKVVRFWNNEIDNNIEGVYEVLLKYLS